MGLEVNGNAPGIGKWASYLMFKGRDAVDLVRTNMILAGTAAETLGKIGRIAGASLTIHPEDADVVGRLDEGLADGFKELKKAASNAREITVAFELGTQKRAESLDLRFKDKIAEFLSQDDAQQALEEFKVRAFDQRAGRTQDIDLLEDKFVGYRKVVTLDTAGRVVDSASIFSAIDSVAEEVLGIRRAQ